MERLYCSTMMIETDKSKPSHYLEIIIDNFDVNGFMDLAEAYVGPIKDALFCRLMEGDFALGEGSSNEQNNVFMKEVQMINYEDI